MSTHSVIFSPAPAGNKKEATGLLLSVRLHNYMIRYGFA